MKTALFLSCGHCWVFQIYWHIECSTFTASSFIIWNSSTGIPSPPLALFIVMLSKAHLTSHSRMSGSEWSHHHDYLGHEDPFCTVLLCILATSSDSVRSLPFLSIIAPIFAWNVPLVYLIFFIQRKRILHSFQGLEHNQHFIAFHVLLLHPISASLPAVAIVLHRLQIYPWIQPFSRSSFLS